MNTELDEDGFPVKGKSCPLHSKHNKLHRQNEN